MAVQVSSFSLERNVRRIGVHTWIYQLYKFNLLFPPIFWHRITQHSPNRYSSPHTASLHHHTWRWVLPHSIDFALSHQIHLVWNPIRPSEYVMVHESIYGVWNPHLTLCLITCHEIYTSLLGVAVEVMVILEVTMMDASIHTKNGGIFQRFSTFNTQNHVGCNSIHLPSSNPTSLIVILM